MKIPKVSPALAKRLATQFDIGYFVSDTNRDVRMLQAFGNACVQDVLERMTMGTDTTPSALNKCVLCGRIWVGPPGVATCGTCVQ